MASEITLSDIRLSDVRSGLKRLQVLLDGANQHLPGNEIVADALVNAAREEVANLLDASRV